MRRRVQRKVAAVKTQLTVGKQRTTNQVTFHVPFRTSTAPVHSEPHTVGSLEAGRPRFASKCSESEFDVLEALEKLSRVLL